MTSIPKKQNGISTKKKPFSDLRVLQKKIQKAFLLTDSDCVLVLGEIILNLNAKILDVSQQEDAILIAEHARLKQA